MTMASVENDQIPMTNDQQGFHWSLVIGHWDLVIPIETGFRVGRPYRPTDCQPESFQSGCFAGAGFFAAGAGTEAL